jgi:hypothetical protein
MILGESPPFDKRRSAAFSWPAAQNALQRRPIPALLRVLG